MPVPVRVVKRGPDHHTRGHWIGNHRGRWVGVNRITRLHDDPWGRYINWVRSRRVYRQTSADSNRTNPNTDANLGMTGTWGSQRQPRSGQANRRQRSETEHGMPPVVLSPWDASIPP